MAQQTELRHLSLFFILFIVLYLLGAPVPLNSASFFNHITSYLHQPIGVKRPHIYDTLNILILILPIIHEHGCISMALHTAS